MIIVGTGRGARHILRDGQDHVLCGRWLSTKIEYPANVGATCFSCLYIAEKQRAEESRLAHVFRYVYKGKAGIVPMAAVGHIEYGSKDSWIGLCPHVSVWQRHVVDDYPLPGRRLCTVCRSAREDIKSV